MYTPRGAGVRHDIYTKGEGVKIACTNVFIVNR